MTLGNFQGPLFFNDLQTTLITGLHGFVPYLLQKPPKIGCVGGRPLTPCDIQQRMDEHYRDESSYRERDTHYELFAREIFQIEQESLRDAVMLRAQLSVYVGDDAGLREQLPRLNSVEHEEIDRLHFAAAFAKPGLLGESRQILRPMINYSDGLLAQVTGPAFAAGLIGTVLQEYERASNNGVACAEPHTTCARGVTLALMHSLGLHDEQIIPQVDALGSVAHQHKKLLIGTAVSGLSVPGEFEGLRFYANLMATPDELVESNLCVAALKEEMGIPALHGWTAISGWPHLGDTLPPLPSPFNNEARHALHTH